MKKNKSSLRRILALWRLLEMQAWRLVRRFYLRVIILLLPFIIVLGVWSLWIEPDSLTVKAVALELPGWSPNLKQFKIVALSDFHVGSPHITLEKLHTIVQLTNEQKPDLIVLLGDYVIQGVIGGQFTEPEDFVDVLKDLKAEHGVYAVLGNHDWIYGDERITQAFERVGIPVLTNDAVEIKHNGDGFWLAGIGDYFSRHQDIEKALAKINSPEPIIVITHTPDIFLKLPPQVTLTLAGHTHGGQVNLPLLGRRIVPSDFGEKYAIGYVEENGRRLFVTPGIGTSIFPVRFRVPPEISVLTINAKK